MKNNTSWSENIINFTISFFEFSVILLLAHYFKLSVVQIYYRYKILHTWLWSFISFFTEYLCLLNPFMIWIYFIISLYCNRKFKIIYQKCVFNRPLEYHTVKWTHSYIFFPEIVLVNYIFCEDAKINTIRSKLFSLLKIWIWQNGRYWYL